MNTTFRLTLFSLWLLTSQAFAAQKVALVIGNSQYQNVQDSLKNPVNDAKAIAARFKELGFDTEMLPNANLDTMLEAINRARSKVDANGTLIFYYAGHGVQLDGKNYLVPVDARMANPDRVQRETIQVKEVIDKFNDSSAAVRVLMLDACRNDPFPKAHRSGTRGLAREELQLNKGMMVLYAASQGEVAEDGAANHGTFTDALLRGLSQPNIKLPELMDDVTTQVQQKTQNKQNPYYEGTGLSRFVLVPAAPVVSTPIQPAQDTEITFWNSIASSTDASDYVEYLKAYPSGKFSGLAQSRKDKYTVKPQQLVQVRDKPEYPIRNPLDVIEKNLRPQLQGSGVGIFKQKNGSLLLISPANIVFPLGQVTIKPDFFDTLNNIALALKNNKIVLTVSGHTDSLGKDDFNLKISQERATAIAQYLWTQGVKTSINAIGLGKSQPIADNATEVGRAQNRRVEITVSLQE